MNYIYSPDFKLFVFKSFKNIFVEFPVTGPLSELEGFKLAINSLKKRASEGNLKGNSLPVDETFQSINTLDEDYLGDEFKDYKYRVCKYNCMNSLEILYLLSTSPNFFYSKKGVSLVYNVRESHIPHLFIQYYRGFKELNIKVK